MSLPQQFAHSFNLHKSCLSVLLIGARVMQAQQSPKIPHPHKKNPKFISLYLNILPKKSQNKIQNIL